MFQDNVKRIDAVFKEPLSAQKIFYSSTLHKTIKIFDYSLSLEDTLPIFLVGDVGSGKSTTLQILHNHAQKTHQTYFLHRPFPDKDAYIEFLSQSNHIPYEKGMDNEAIILAITKKNLQPTVLFIDAFELMSYEQMYLTFQLKNIPFLTIVCATRITEAEKIFNNINFKLNHKVSLTCSPLSIEDIKKYIYFILEYSQEIAYSKLFTQSVCADLHDYTKGNWQVLNKFLHKLFKLIVYENIMGNRIEKLSCVMLAKIALEQKILNVERFKKKCLLQQVVISCSMFGSIFQISTFFIILAILFITYKMDLNATGYPSITPEQIVVNVHENQSTLNENSLKNVVEKQEYNMLTLHVRFPPKN